MKKILLLTSALALSAGAFAQNATQTQNHFKLYGFVRNYFAFDTRESSAGTEDLYYYMPKDEKLNTEGEDLNAIPSFRFAALTSRLGVDVSGYQYNGYKMGAKIEADFYSGLSGVTGTATLRLRQAFATVSKDGRNWKIGQAWHPMAADLPDIFSLDSGVPFAPFSRTPQVTFEQSLGNGFSLTGSAIWQMQYTSTGPDGASANYIKYGCTPEIYAAVNHKTANSILRVGADVLSIKPRNYNADKTATVSDRLTTINFYEYYQTKMGDWTFREKAIYANDGSHMNMVGGYGVSEINSDGSWEYSATHTVSAWLTGMYKTKGSNWVPQFYIAYLQNLGTADEIVGGSWFKNSASTVAQMYRIQPELLYNLGKLQIGFEYMLTSVQYGTADKHIHATDNLHWVANHRIQSMVKFNF